MTSPTSRVDTALACPDPECTDDLGARSLAEPDQDGDVAFHVCPKCGYEFGYQRLEQRAVNSDGACAVGVPEAVRRRASGPAESLVDPLPLLQIRKRSTDA